MKRILIIGMLLFAFASTNAQETVKKSRKERKADKEALKVAETKTLLESKTYVFRAANVNPMQGRNVILDARYRVKIENDTIDSYLPYFGRAYSVDYGSTKSGMEFTKPIEDYTFEVTKNGYRVKLDVKNGNDNLAYTFDISKNGSTTLNVISVNRQSISYYGDIEKIEKEK